jgi:hypothetical protein
VEGVSTFGVFVEILPGVRGLCHISELEVSRSTGTDAWEQGDRIDVKLIEVHAPVPFVSTYVLWLTFMATSLWGPGPLSKLYMEGRICRVLERNRRAV